ncbi:FapA family protein [Paenibacillus sp.]|uniref:FapA family protein n=1 Tax=Paenibacillus sp. TaxID=58172 RepID=UPI002D394C4E|nr:FapA family protein [Paenibacillus sp.]HZG86114.1 FapA family protein [Paenibacillus sp.]
MSGRDLTDEELLRLIRELGGGGGSPLAPSKSDRSVRADGSWAMIVGGDVAIHYGAGFAAGDIVMEAKPPVKLYVNGAAVDGKAILEKGDRVGWSVEEPPMFRIHVSPDGIQAHLHIRAAVRKPWRLLPKEASSHLVLEAGEDEEGAAQPLSAADVIGRIHEMGVSCNLNLPAILQEIAEPTYEPVLIARGVEPIPSRDAELTLYFAERIESVFRETDGSIDFKNHLRIPQAAAGERIARRTAPVPGVAGRNVFNQAIVPPAPADVPIRAGRYVDITPDGDVIALKAGRPKLSGDRVKLFDITTEYVVFGDVDLAKGNIVFSGDVVIYGDVLEGMIVESLGNTYVFGNVYGATITATGSIYISGNATNSYLYSGYFGVVYNRLYSYTKALGEQLESLLAAAAELERAVRAQGRTARVGHLLATLASAKFAGVPKTIQESLAALTHVRRTDGEEWGDLRRQLEAVSGPLGFLGLASAEPLERLRELASRSFETIERMQERQVTIQFAQCNGTTVKSNGDIAVTKEGTFQSRLFARDGIVFKSSGAVCRGGELEAGGLIALMSVGGQSGGEAVIRSNQRILAERIYMAKLCIGRSEQYVQRPMQQVTAYLNRGRLIVEGEAI